MSVEWIGDRKVLGMRDPSTKSILDICKEPPPKEVVTPDALKSGYKADEGKSRVDLIPPEVLIELGNLYGMGAKKYSPENWKLGMDYRRVYGAMLRHAYKFWMGETHDPVDGQHHLDSTIWSAIALRYYELYPDKYAKFDTRTQATRAVEGDQK